MQYIKIYCVLLVKTIMYLNLIKKLNPQHLKELWVSFTIFIHIYKQNLVSKYFCTHTKDINAFGWYRLQSNCCDDMRMDIQGTKIIYFLFVLSTLLAPNEQIQYWKRSPSRRFERMHSGHNSFDKHFILLWLEMALMSVWEI